jgi:hypothetical protein
MMILAVVGNEPPPAASLHDTPGTRAGKVAAAHREKRGRFGGETPATAAVSCC